MRTIILAHIINPLTDRKAELIFDGALIVVKGKIQWLGQASQVEIKASDNVIDHSAHVVIPSFFDMHFHWVQDDVREMPKANLLHWLENYTFPAEKKFQNKRYSEQKAKQFFQRLIDVGTLGGACYSSIHEHALEHAFKYVRGDFVIGNVLMTMNSPSYLTQSSQQAVDIVARMSQKHGKKYALTPRFAIATDPTTMQDSAQKIKGTGAYIQTHLSETKGEIAAVKDIYRDQPGFEKAKTYTEIYHKAKMLGPKTIMGHGIHLAAEELKLLARTNTAIAHCPTSNAPHRQLGLGSGLFDFRKIERAKVRWALASDIGGGPFLSMLDVIQSFVSQNQRVGITQATYTKGLYRATLAGAEILKVHKKSGNLTPGKEANLVVLPQVRKRLDDTSESVLKRLINGKKRRLYDGMISHTYYRGELVSHTA